MMVTNTVKSTYTGLLLATSGNGMKCRYKTDVDASSPEEARLKIRSEWQAQATQPGMHIQYIQLWKDGEPVV